MSATIFDMVTAPAMAAYWTESQSNREPYMGEVLFPARKKPGLSLSWIRGYRNLPIALKPSAFDAKAEIRDRIGVKKVETEMPFFREGMLIKEKDRQDLLTLQEGSPYFEMIVQEIFNDYGQLVNGALVQSERLRMQLLFGMGKINISAAGVSYVYDFDQSGDYQANNYIELLTTAKWTDHDTSTPLQDLQAAMEAIELKHGTIITRMIMTRATWSHLLLNKSMKMDMNVMQGQNIILTDTMLKQYIASKLSGVAVALYNKKFKDEAGVEYPFVPDGYVALLPDGDLGNTWYGTTPEEADLLGGSDAQVAVVNTGVTLTTYRQVHPVNVNALVSEIVLPSYERMEETYVIKVF